MNLLEVVITEIHAVEPAEHYDWMGEHEYVRVDISTDTHGASHRIERYFKKDEWEQAKKWGYYYG